MQVIIAALINTGLKSEVGTCEKETWRASEWQPDLFVQRHSTLTFL